MRSATYNSKSLHSLSTRVNEEDGGDVFHNDKIGAPKFTSPPDQTDRQNGVVGFEEQQLTSLLMELPDRVGVLHDVLRFFWKYDVNIRRIESRPSQFGKFDFFVDIEGGTNGDRDERLENLKSSLKQYGVEKLLTLGEKEGNVTFTSM